MWTQIGLLKEQSDLGPHCLPVRKNRFEKFARIFSRRHKQTTFSDAGFLGVLRVKKSNKNNKKKKKKKKEKSKTNSRFLFDRFLVSYNVPLGLCD